MKLDRDTILEALLTEMHNHVASPDTRSDISIQQTSYDSSEMQDVIAHIRNCNGDVKWIEDGAMMAYTNNKVSLFQILDYLDENDDVLDYEFLTDIDILDIQNYLDKLKQRKIPIEFFKLADEQIMAYHGILKTELPNAPIFKKIMQKDIERALLNNR